MTKYEIVKDVVRIILKYAKPERIYLYGSQASGEASTVSDIDIAYEDMLFKDNYLIEEELEQMQTLIKIEVKNLAWCEERFKNRVKSTGKVIFSANKELRAQDSLYNFVKALEKFSNVAARREEFYKEGYGDVYLDLVVKRFEFTYEMSWKTIKRYMDFIGIDCPNPRSCFKEALVQGLITDETVWLEMIERRNLSSHMYDEDEIKEILQRLNDYVKAFRNLKESMDTKLIKKK